MSVDWGLQANASQLDEINAAATGSISWDGLNINYQQLMLSNQSFEWSG